MNIALPRSTRGLLHQTFALGVPLTALCLCFPAVAQLYVINGDTIGKYDSTTGQAIDSAFIASAAPSGMAFGSGGTLFVASPTLPSAGYAPGIARYDGQSGASLGDLVTYLNDSELNNPAGLAFGPAGHLYAADLTTSKILAYDNAGNRVATLSDAQLGTPSGLAFSGDGTLYVADSGLGNVLSYSGGSFQVVNSVPGVFNAAHDVVDGAGGTLFVLDTLPATSGIYRLTLSDGSSQKIVDFSSSPFYAAGLTLGPDGGLYVSGVDSSSGSGQVLRYGTDGSGGSVFTDLGLNATPGAIVFAPVPEPSSLALASFASLWCAWLTFRRSRAS